MSGTFKVLIQNGNTETVEERNYADIWHVNFWINKHGNPVYRVYMTSGEKLFVADNKQFSRKRVPLRVNAIDEVRKRKLL